MNRLQGRPLSLADRDAITEHVARDKLSAAVDLDLEFELKAGNARQRPKLYKPGRMKGTCEIVMRPNYVMVYSVTGDLVEVLRVLHAAQK